MKAEIMRRDLPNPTQFIINYISLWSRDQVEEPICAMLYQEYRTWCEANSEKAFTSNTLGKIYSKINIEPKRADSGKRAWLYILNQFKIVAKIRESIGDIEEFSDIPQTETFTNTTSTDIPVFDIPEIV